MQAQAQARVFETRRRERKETWNWDWGWMEPGYVRVEPRVALLWLVCDRLFPVVPTAPQFHKHLVRSDSGLSDCPGGGDDDLWAWDWQEIAIQPVRLRAVQNQDRPLPS